MACDSRRRLHVLCHCSLKERVLTERRRSPHKVTKARCCRTKLCAMCFATLRLSLLEAIVIFQIVKSPAHQW